MKRTLTGLGMALALVGLAPDGEGGKDPAVGTAYRVPYRLTKTNHYLVRVRVNGKGPFNFLVDTGAPAMYVGTEAAEAIGLKAAEDSFWTPVDRLDIEGGAVLKGVKARVEDPFQLTGMNALGLPGAKIDGILGFTILAKFRMEFDPTRDRMTWTRLDYDPKEPFVPKPDAKAKPANSAELQMMNALGPAMKLAAAFVGKQPEDALVPRGRLGFEVLEEPKGEVLVAAVWPGSPAEKAGLQKGDRLTAIGGKAIASSKAAHEAVAKVKAGDEVKVSIKRGSEEKTVDLTAAEGL